MRKLLLSTSLLILSLPALAGAPPRPGVVGDMPKSVIDCKPLSGVLESLKKHSDVYRDPIIIVADEAKLKIIRSFYNHVKHVEDEDTPEWNLAVIAIEPDKGGVLMVGFSADMSSENEKGLPRIDGICSMVRMSAASYEALDNELNGHRS